MPFGSLRNAVRTQTRAGPLRQSEQADQAKQGSHEGARCADGNTDLQPEGQHMPGQSCQTRGDMSGNCPTHAILLACAGIRVE